MPRKILARDPFGMAERVEIHAGTSIIDTNQPLFDVANQPIDSTTISHATRSAARCGSRHPDHDEAQNCWRERYTGRPGRDRLPPGPAMG